MIDSISTRKGKARMMSTSRMKMASTIPPKKPAIVPSVVPMMKGKRTPMTAICRSMRVPQMTRERISRPKLSVPNGCSHDGALQPRRCVLGDRIVGRDQRRAKRQDDERAEEEHAGGQGAAAAEAAASAGEGSCGDQGFAHSFTRGSSATVTMSARKLISTVAQANTIATPCTTM